MKFESEDIVFTPITSLLSEVIDNRGRTCPTAEIGIPLIATNCIGNENLYPVKKNIRYVSLETYKTWFRGHPEPGDVIFVNKGTPGRVCLVPDPIDFCIAQDMVSLRVNEHINNLYLLAALRSPQVQNQIQQMQVGTMIPHFKKGDFEKLLIPMRDIPTQKDIGKIYFELSQKIDVNERTSKTLEGIAQTIFKSWFIDFDPVKAKMAGEKPVGMDAATAALFPDSMEDSEIGLIPKGWKVRSIGDSVIKQKVGKLFDSKTSFSDGSVPVLDQGKSGVVGFHDEEPGVFASPNEPLVVFANHTCLLRLISYPFSVIQNVFALVGNKVDVIWLYFAVEGKQQFDSYKGHWPDFVLHKIIHPTENATNAFRLVVEPLLKQKWLLEQQSKMLANLRDSLLPRLISGELQIPEEMLAS
jgi:type I restriction enzyme S subunit